MYNVFIVIGFQSLKFEKTVYTGKKKQKQSYRKRFHTIYIFFTLSPNNYVQKKIVTVVLQ